jgi:F0F1-type ATP synthase assembly protein I
VLILIVQKIIQQFLSIDLKFEYMKKYFKPFLITLFTYPVISWIINLVFKIEKQWWQYLLSGVLFAPFIVIYLYFLDKRKRGKN